ncbi:MAG: hypothetical protein JWP25_7587 [Bradyrhizobium sp.]|nr:hypothetical protein [Bradyrhizobium sp.]
MIRWLRRARLYYHDDTIWVWLLYLEHHHPTHA